MNRTIKFRVWNGEEMISPDYIDRDGIAYWKENSIPNYSDKIMQFTGLLDRSGVWIYEGDIVRHTGKAHGEIILEVFYTYKPCLREIGTGRSHAINQIKTRPENFEVIGNIYQNKNPGGMWGSGKIEIKQ